MQKLVADLGSAFPSAFSLYWRTLPMRRMKKLLTAAFFTFSVLGFSVDLLSLGGQRLGRGFFWPVFMGAMATSLLAARVKRIRLFPFLFLIMAAVFWWAIRVSYSSTPSPVPAALKSRVLFDAVGILIGAGTGYRLLISFVTTEGRENVRMETELSLAHGIQATLVPTVSFQTARFEAYGKSIPSKEMGGDLIDVIEGDGNLLAYVADISGHGLPAGQLMGMLKTAMRVSVQFRQEPVALLESADRVLPALKEPEMYATLALLYFDGSAEVEYASAGHVPILHYRDRTGDTVRLSMNQFPLGLIAGGCYTSQRISYSSRDLFLMLTDGILEVPNEKDEEFGLTRLEQLLTQHAKQALPQIWELIMSDVKQYGVQQDDQSLFLLRTLS
ncbi:MAG TPA: PP2C family protein-serine/threonine phosphatase [Candidatus Acidoferrum sp.]|nr:PP2C family protein-serine/threonine phosphatase [Candidatus Acidoferrum sp.]